MKMPGHKGVAEKRLLHRQRPYVRTIVEREAFWAVVRGRIAVLRLNQKTVAKAVNLDRSVLTRRPNCQIKDRPSELRVSQLASVLALGGAEKQELHRPAGYRPQAAVADLHPASQSRPVGTGRPRNYGAGSLLVNRGVTDQESPRASRYILTIRCSSFQPIEPFASTSGRKSQKVTP
jgi:hypothetical protein